MNWTTIKTLLPTWFRIYKTSKYSLHETVGGGGADHECNWLRGSFHWVDIVQVQTQYRKKNRIKNETKAKVFTELTVHLASCVHHLNLPKLSCLEESSHGHLSELN